MHAEIVFGPNARAEAWSDFWCGRERHDASCAATFVDSLFVPYFLFSWLPDPKSKTYLIAPHDTTIGLNYLDKHGQRLTALE